MSVSFIRHHHQHYVDTSATHVSFIHVPPPLALPSPLTGLVDGGAERGEGPGHGTVGEGGRQEREVELVRAREIRQHQRHRRGCHVIIIVDHTTVRL